MSEIKVNKISQRSGTAITLGNSGTDFQLPSGAELVAQSGSTITIAAGATITNSGTATGFGRTGTVNWDTTKKTTGFTAVNGVGYFCDTTSAAFTMTLPATPSAGDIVALKDYANTFDTNNLTIGRNGSNINGSASNALISVQGQSLTLIYIDATQGWSAIYGATDADLPLPTYIVATGGTITTCGNFKIHTFTGPGTFTVCSVGNPAGSTTVDYLVVAGGAGGGRGSQASGGGGGAGGLRFSASTYTAPPTSAPRAGSALPVSAQGYPITVGSGGAGTPINTQRGSNGNDSVFSTITSAGGGGGGSRSGTAQPYNPGGPGASGGGGVGDQGGDIPGGTGNTPPVAPSQGNNGGTGYGPAGHPAGGGGGAGAVGQSVPNGSKGGDGGVGLQINIDTNSYYWAGGGGGAQWSNYPGCAPGGAGGLGGGGGGKQPGSGGTSGAGGGSALNAGAPGNPPNNGGPGGTNTGGGGGGSNNCTPAAAGSGGSGIVIIRYRYQ